VGDKIVKNEIGGVCSADGGKESINRILLRKPDGKGPLGRPMRRWEDNIKRDLREWDGGMDWIGPRIGAGG
jgi:hypothetical protein